jgi:hypothetical protein
MIEHLIAKTVKYRIRGRYILHQRDLHIYFLRQTVTTTTTIYYLLSTIYRATRLTRRFYSLLFTSTIHYLRRGSPNHFATGSNSERSSTRSQRLHEVGNHTQSGSTRNQQPHITRQPCAQVGSTIESKTRIEGAGLGLVTYSMTTV